MTPDLTLVDELCLEAQDGPWWPDPIEEENPCQEMGMWLTNAQGDSLLVQSEDVAALLNAALKEARR